MGVTGWFVEIVAEYPSESLYPSEALYPNALEPVEE